MSDVLSTSEAGPAVVRGGLVRVVGYVTGVLLSVGSAALLFRHLGVAAGGSYVLVVSIVTIAIGVTEGGLGVLGVRELVRHTGEEGAARLRALLGLRIVLSVAGIAIACGYAAVAGLSGRLVLGTAIAGVASLVQGVHAVLSALLQAQMRFTAVTVADLSRMVANTVAIVVLVAAGAGLVSFFAALVFAAACGLVVCVIYIEPALRARPALDLARSRELFGLAGPYVIATAVSVLYLRAGLLLLDWLTDPHETGLYGISFRVIEVAGTVPSLLVGAAFPLFAHTAVDDPERLRYGVQRTLEASVALGGLGAVCLAVGAPAVIEIVGGPRFAAADAVLRWHGIALWGTFAAQPLGYALLALGRTRGLLAMTVVALAACIGSSIPLALAAGAPGAAAGAAIAEWALFATAAVALQRAGGPRLELLRLWRVPAAAAIGVLPILVLPALPAAAAGAVLYVAVLWRLGGIPEELLSAWRR